jgi:hypothetical protein
MTILGLARLLVVSHNLYHVDSLQAASVGVLSGYTMYCVGVLLYYVMCTVYCVLRNADGRGK